ncbi:hypothetical protein D915_005319 [Fasciola hepatica]|uniref:Uncharacterized protein n=1 Tax=Fasciola hepatica TaxID=6192 RepID=A0A4E0S0R7_FASHE|nr:hypothetical protein D915_005319 [Fasciola hepatica]
MASSKNQSSDSSSVSSDPVSESATSSSIRSAYGRTKMKTTEQRRDASKTHIGATTFASRQRALTTDPLSSARSAISRTNNTGSQLKKALSSISVEQTGLNSNTAETYTQSSGFQRDRDSQRAFPDDSSSDVAHIGSLPLGRTMSHVILTSPTVTHRSPSTRARWLPESSSSPKYSDSVVNMTDTLGSAANTSFVGGKPLRHSPTTPAVIRPSELRLTPASQTGKIVPAPAQKQHCSLPTSGMADANGPEPTVNESSSSEKSDPEPTAIQHKQQRPTRLVIADSSSNSALEESDQFLATRSALEAVQEALALAVQRCSEFKNTELGRADHNLNALRTLVTNELEWRFAQLRAMLDLSPICVEPPVARVLLADLVERLIPELRARSTELDRMDCAAPGSETKPAITQDKSLDEWIADSTTEATALNCAAEADDEVVQDQDPAREDYACDDLLQQTAYTDRVSWTLDTRAVVSEET